MNHTTRRGHHVAARLQARGAWPLLEFTLYGMIFLLLGLQLPGILGGALRQTAREAGNVGAWRLLGQAAAVFVVLLALRFAWTFATLRLEVTLRRWRTKPRPMPSLR